jgi:transposase
LIDRKFIVRIRHLFFAEHWKVGTIATDLGLHHETVKLALYGGPRPVPPPRPSALDPYIEFMRETLEKHPRLTATRLHRMLCERGYKGSARQVRRRVTEIRPRRSAEAFLRRRTFPGEEGQTDWGSFGRIPIGRATRPLSCFVKTLTYSRNFYLEFFLDQIQESFLLGHVHAFDDFEGVPRVDLCDNLRSAVLERYGQAVHFHPRLLELAAHYHFEPRACTPARGSEKGAVERTIRYIRDSFFAARTITSLERLNQEALDWRDQVALERRWPGGDHKTVAEAFEEEKPFLLPLPQNPFDTDLMIPIRARKTIYIRFDGNDYSIPPKLVEQPLSLVASQKTVRLLHGTNEIAHHRRSYDRHQRVENPDHIEALLAIKQGARGSVASARLLGAVPEAEEFLEAAFRKGESVARHTNKLLLLLDDYGPGELRAAMQEALQKDTPRLGSVAYILAKKRRLTHKPAAVTVDLSARPDLKNLYVKPHDSKTYDQLANPDQGAHDEDDND